MKKYEAPMIDKLSVVRDIIANSGLLADLANDIDPVADDIFGPKN